MSWDIHFPNPIQTPSGKFLITLRDAGAYITKLPKDQQGAQPWQTAARCLLQAVDNHGPIEFARLGMMQALYPKGEPIYRSRSTEPKWRNNHKLVRDR
jgi:hypothetical protein